MAVKSNKKQSSFCGPKSFCIVLIFIALFIAWELYSRRQEKAVASIKGIFPVYTEHSDDAMDVLATMEYLHDYLTRSNSLEGSEKNEASRAFRHFIANLRQIASQAKLKGESTSKITNSTCEQVYLGARSDYPHYLTNWKFKSCSNTKPLSALLTFCFQSFDAMQENDLINTFNFINNKYGNVPIILGTDSSAFEEIAKKIPSLIIKKLSKSENRMQLWKDLAKSSNTPFVFLGRSFDGLGQYTNLTRAIQILSEISTVGAVSFGNLNKDRIWNIDCFQVSLMNYQLRIIEGYKRSFNECVVCGYANGPLMIKSSILKTHELDVNVVEEDLGFLDLFLRLYQEGQIIVSCPDMMSLVSRPNTALHLPKTNWLPFVQKWGINEVEQSDGFVYQFSCAESKISCSVFSYNDDGLYVPSCCLKAQSKMLNDVVTFCNKYNIHFEIDTGSALAATKFNSPLPWDLDLDGGFHKDNITTFMAHKSELEQMGYSIHDENNVHYLRIACTASELNSISMDIWTYRPYISVGNMYTGLFKPTMMIFSGFLVNVPYNPGLFSRNRYGKEMYRHSAGWSTHGRSNSYADYEGGQVITCKKPHHHGCMQQTSADGNIMQIEERTYSVRANVSRNS